MVKKISYSGLAFAFVLTVAIVGCNKEKNPVIPANAAVLHLTLPSGILASLPKTVSAQDAVPDATAGALEYYLSTEGQAPVTGVVLFTSGANVGNIYINLPKAGTWLIAAEWFYTGNIGVQGAIKKAKAKRAKLTVPGYEIVSPEFVGADEVNVQGTTSFTLNMEDINYTENECYNADITDLGTDSCEGENEDLFSFNTDTSAYSTAVSAAVGDIQGLYDAVTTNTTYISSWTGSSFAYLGNGDLVDYPVVPTGATFYSNTLAAKTAVAGSASAPIAPNDIFVVKIPSQNAMVWLQVTADDNNDCDLNDSTIYFWFVYNNQGLNYMKFDQTTYGQAFCNENNPPPT